MTATSADFNQENASGEYEYYEEWDYYSEDEDKPKVKSPSPKQQSKHNEVKKVSKDFYFAEHVSKP